MSLSNEYKAAEACVVIHQNRRDRKKAKVREKQVKGIIVLELKEEISTPKLALWVAEFVRQLSSRNWVAGLPRLFVLYSASICSHSKGLFYLFIF